MSIGADGTEHYVASPTDPDRLTWRSKLRAAMNVRVPNQIGARAGRGTNERVSESDAGAGQN